MQKLDTALTYHRTSDTFKSIMKLSLPRTVRLPHSRLLLAIWLPRPGTKRGACVEVCDHEICGRLHQAANLRCVICGDLLGWENPIYQVVAAPGDHGLFRLVHALCSHTARSY